MSSFFFILRLHILLPTGSFRSFRNSGESFLCTQCYHKPYQIKSPPCKVSTPICAHDVGAILTIHCVHHAKFQILLMYLCYHAQTKLDLYHAKFQILLVYTVLPQCAPRPTPPPLDLRLQASRFLMIFLDDCCTG